MPGKAAIPAAVAGVVGRAEQRQDRHRRTSSSAIILMTYLSVDEQDAEIRRLFPDFRLTAHADWIGVWEGPVTPASKTYAIRIVYFRRRFFDGWNLATTT